MAVAEVVALDHVARETSDMSRFVNFYQELFGFEETASFEIEGTKVKWLYLAGVYTMHVIERSTNKPHLSKPYSPPPIVEFTDLASAHHFCFTLSNFDFFVQVLKERGIETFLTGNTTDEKAKRAFFFDPDGNLLEVQSTPC